MIYVGIDDTDVPGSPGTNKVARAVIQALLPRFKPLVSIRHQLLVDPRVPYTSKNSSASVVFCRDAYEAARGSECLVIMTDWNEFKELDFKRLKKLLKQPVIIDGRNIYDPAKMKKLGFIYTGVGRR